MKHSQHVRQWLDAYHDGELQGRRRKQVEAHLAECGACREELAAFETLSAALQSEPGPAGVMPPDQFVTQVNLRLLRRPAMTPLQRVLVAAWRLTPVGLLVGWTFVQATLLVTSGLLLVLRLTVSDRALAQLLPLEGVSWMAHLAELSEVGWPEIIDTLVVLIRSGGPLGWGVTVNVALTIVVGLLYWSWLAGSWALRQHRLKQSANGTG